MNRTDTEKREIEHWSELLSEQAEAGELQPIKGTAAPRDENAPALSDDDLLAIFRGREREEPQRPA